MLSTYQKVLEQVKEKLEANQKELNRIERRTVEVYRKDDPKREIFLIEKWYRDGRTITFKEMLDGIDFEEDFQKLTKEKESLLEYQDKLYMKIADEKFQKSKSELHAWLLQDYFAEWREELQDARISKTAIEVELLTTEISGDAKITKDHNIQIDEGDVISAKSIMIDGSVANDIVIGKSADTFRGGTYSYYLKDLTQTNAYADYYQQENYYQLTTAEVIKTEAKSESPVYGTFQAQDSDRIKRVLNPMLKSELTNEDNEVQETKYGKFIFQESMRGNPEISALAGAIEDQAMSVTDG